VLGRALLRLPGLLQGTGSLSGQIGREMVPNSAVLQPEDFALLLSAKVSAKQLLCSVFNGNSSIRVFIEKLSCSQNPSMAGVGRALCGSLSPTPCPSRVTQSRLHSTASRRGWNIFREGDSVHGSCSPVFR